MLGDIVSTVLEAAVVVAIVAMPDIVSRASCSEGCARRKGVTLRGAGMAFLAYALLVLSCKLSGMPFLDKISGGAFAVVTGGMLNQVSRECRM